MPRDGTDQVILGVLVNGTHAIAEKIGDSPGGEKEPITISTSKAGNGMELRIRDMGNNYWNRQEIIFYTTKEVGKSTGQGLAISHDVIVGRHQGTISVESTMGKGTTFIVTLPLQEEKEHE